MASNEIARRTEEILAPGAIQAVHQAEIDSQIATARRFPRKLDVFRQRAVELATTSEDFARRMQYRLERKYKNRETGQWETKIITGPSIRMAEVVTHCYGNIRSAGRIIAEDDTTVTAEGIAMDLENNNAVRIEVTNSIVNAEGRRYTTDMVIVTKARAVATARRNAIFGVVPRVLVEEILLDVGEKMQRATPKRSHADQVASMLSMVKELHGITKKKVLAFLGRTHDKDVTVKDLQRIAGVLTSIEDGLTTAKEAFAGEQEKPAQQTKAQSRSDDLGLGADERPAVNAGAGVADEQPGNSSDDK
jgi:hypothetical protein